MIFLNRRILIPFCIYVLILVGVVLIGIRPLIAQVHQSTLTLQARQQEHTDKQSKLQQLKTLDSVKFDIASARSLSLAAIPETTDQDHLLPLLEKIVSDNHATLTNLDVKGGPAAATAATPGKKGTAAAKTSGLATIFGTVDFTGSYEVIQQTLIALENNQRLLTITSASISVSNASSAGEISASVKLTAYGKGVLR